jgi:hypothetical protein
LRIADCGLRGDCGPPGLAAIQAPPAISNQQSAIQEARL